MKKILLLLFYSCPLLMQAQPLRYFEFATNCGHNHWQDTAFVAATSDTAVINALLAEIGNPTGKFISGPIAHGNAGYNRNASHWFLWHFKPSKWRLAENAIEVCDGCPYSDIDADTAYWIGLLGEFCPWSGIPKREVSGPTGIAPGPETSIIPYPNPVTQRIFVKGVQELYPDGAMLSLYNAQGQIIITEHYSAQGLSMTGLAQGVYLLEIKGLQTGPAFRYKLVKE